MITMAVRVMAESDLFLKIKLSEKLESKQLPKKIIAIIRYDCQYCQDRNINILNRVFIGLTRLSISKHTLVNILTIGQPEHP